MSSIPLPALAIHPPQQQEGPMDNYAKLMQIKAMMGGQQLQQQQLQGAQLENQTHAMQNQQLQAQMQTQQAFSKALVDTNGDYEKAFDVAQQKYSANPLFLMPMRQQVMEYKKNVIGYDTTQQEYLQKQANLKQGAIDLVNQAKPEDKPTVYQQQIAQLKSLGVPGLDQMPPQYPGDDVFKIMAATNRGHDQMIKDAISESEASKNQAQAQEAQAKTGQINAEMASGGSSAMADAKYRNLQASIAQGQPVSTLDKAWMKGYEKQKLLVPVASANIRVEGMGKIRQFPVYDAQTKQTVYMDSNEINDARLREPGRYTVPQYSPEAIQQQGAAKASVTPGVANEVVAFNTASQHAELLQKASDAMKNGDMRGLNKIGNELGVQFGSDKTTNYRVIANAYSREVTKALAAGHMTDAEISSAGATMPDNASPAQIAGAVNSYKALMQSKLQQRQKQFESGSKGQLPFGQQQNAAPQGGVTVTAPNGKVYTFKDQAAADAFKQKAGLK